MARGRGRPKNEAKSKTPAGWTEEQWLDMQRRWREDLYGALDWALVLNLKNERGEPMEWDDRRFLVDILCDMHPRQVIVKCTQVGLSTVMIFKTHFLAQVFGYYIIYTLPHYKLLLDFDKTKISPLFAQNPHVYPTGDVTIGAHVYEKAGFVLFRGTMGDAQDISLTADLIVSDETDKSDLSVVEGLESRLMASKYKGQWWFTNPTTPGIGTDKKWQISDRREWHVKCPHCGAEQPLDYWENVVKEKYKDEDGNERTRAYFACSVCNREWKDDKTVRRNGRWIATNPNPDVKWHGYHISQLCAPWVSAGDLVEYEETKSKEHFYNFILGLPVEGEGITVDRGLIMQNVVSKDDPRMDLLKKATKKFMGVDVGRQLHCYIGNEYGLTKLVCLGDDADCQPKDRDNLDSPKSKWGKLVQLMSLESISLCVIDNGPATKQVDFQKRFRYKVWRCIYDYNDKREKTIEQNRDVGTLNVHRTRIIDETVEKYGKGETLIFLDEHDPLLDGTGKKSGENCLTHHWGTFYQVGLDGSDENIVKKDKQGNVIRTWENRGPDHFGHANVYYEIARQVGTPLGGGSSFMLGDFRGSPNQGGDDDDFPGDKTDDLTFYN